MSREKRIAILWWGYLLLAAFLLITAVYFGSILGMGCAVCALLFSIIRAYSLSIAKKDEAAQKRLCKWTGVFLLLPSLGLMAHCIGILIYEDKMLPLSASIVLIAGSAIMATGQVLHIILLRKDKSTAARFGRQVDFAALSAPSALIVVLSLTLSQTDDAAILSCMSSALFGFAALLLAVNMIVVSRCGYQNTRDSIRSVSHYMKSQRQVFTRVSIVKDVFLVIGKAALSVISVSFFMFVNALYSTGMGIARFVALKMHSQDHKKQITSYRNVGIIILIASFCYVLYSIRLFFGGSTADYPMMIALVIAMYTFFEFGINIRDAIKLRKSKALEAKALRAISFASTLLCFVLTQTAIMSFSAEGDHSFTNALSGVVFGGIAMLVGVYVIMQSRAYGKQTF